MSTQIALEMGLENLSQVVVSSVGSILKPNYGTLELI